MDLFLKISVIQANLYWLGDLEKKYVLGKNILVGNGQFRVSEGVSKSRIAATRYLP